MRFACLIIFLLHINLFGQENLNNKTTWLNLELDRGEYKPAQIFGQDGESLFLLRFIKIKDKNFYSIEKYSLPNLELRKAQLVELKLQEQALSVQKLYMFNGELVISSYFLDKKENKIKCFLHSVDKVSLLPSEPVFIADQVFSGQMTEGNYAYLASTTLDLNFTEDKELAFNMCIKTAPVSDSSNHARYECKVINSNLEIEHEFNFTFPFEKFLMIEKTLSNNGDLYFLGYEYDTLITNDILMKSFANHSENIHVVKVDLVRGTIVNIDIENKNTTFEMLSIAPLDRGGFNICGLTLNESEDLNGTVFINYNGMLQETKRNFKEFDLDFIQEKRGKYASDSQVHKDNTKNFRFAYSIKSFTQNKNGTITVIYEQYCDNTIWQLHHAPLPGHYVTEAPVSAYYFGDIIIINLDNNGKVKYNEIISKSQKSGSYDGYSSSFISVKRNNEINFFYNELESNLVNMDELSRKERKAALNNMVFVKAVIYGDGGKSHSIIYDFPENNDFNIFPSLSFQGDQNSAFFYSKRGKLVQIGYTKYE